MAILIDADVIIQAERGLFDLDMWLQSLPHEEFKLAAIAIHTGSAVATFNKRHFATVKGLKVIEPK